MAQLTDEDREMRIDPDSFAGGYFRNAVYRHWDPYEDIPQADLEADREKFIADDQLTETEFEDIRRNLAIFGAGEEAVTEDLAPLSIALEDINDQMFISSQIYEESKHTQFFDRYWREVINPVAEARDFEVTAPTAEKYFNDAYITLFDRNEAAMHRLLEADTPENRAKAYCHYHLTVESVLAQTGYYGILSAFTDEGTDEFTDREFPQLDGLAEGIRKIRSDEGRHVGFGMHKVQSLIADEGVDPELVRDTLQELMIHVAGTVDNHESGSLDPEPLVEFATEKIQRRIEIITDTEAELPSVDELVSIEPETSAASD